MARAAKFNCIVRIVVLISLLFVCACFESKGPLLRPTDIVTPLPARFYLVQQLQGGGLVFDKSGKPQDLKMIHLSGSTYVDEGAKYSYQLGKLGDEYDKRKMFLAQIESDQTIQYGVVAITDSGLTFRIPSSPQQENKQESPLTIALRSAGVKFFIEESWGSSYYRFDDPEQLLAAGRVLAGDVKFAAAVAIYRLVDSAKPDEVARLKTELAQTQANAGTKSEPQNAQTKKTEPEAVFTNYSHPRLFDAIYRGDADSRAITDLDVVFLQEFLQNFLKSNNCNHLVSDATFIQISTKAEIAAFRNQTSDFFRTQKQHRPTTGPID
jgi:hypothetical protein